MRLNWISTVAATSLCVVSFAVTPALATVNQGVDRINTTGSRSTSGVKTKPAETKPSATKPTSTTVVSTTTTAKRKDRPGKRFWARIMDSFREIHSADKKQNTSKD